MKEKKSLHFLVDQLMKRPAQSNLPSIIEQLELRIKIAKDQASAVEADMQSFGSLVVPIQKESWLRCIELLEVELQEVYQFDVEFNDRYIISYGPAESNELIRVFNATRILISNLGELKILYEKALSLIELPRRDKQDPFEAKDYENLSLIFATEDYTSGDIVDVLSFLSLLYQKVGGDELVIKNISTFSSTAVPQNQLV